MVERRVRVVLADAHIAAVHHRALIFFQLIEQLAAAQQGQVMHAARHAARHRFKAALGVYGDLVLERVRLLLARIVRMVLVRKGMRFALS